MSLPTQYEGLMPMHFVHRPPFMVQTNEKTPAGESPIYRHVKAKDGLHDILQPNIRTIWELLKHSTEQYPDKDAAGTRKLIKVHKETKKVSKVVDGVTKEVDKEWQFFELSPYTFQTYKQYNSDVLNLGSGLRKLGLNKGDKIHVFASTSKNWLSMAHAASSQSLTIVTAYDTLGADGVQHSLTQTKAKGMYTDPHLFKTASGPIKAAEDVEFVIYNDESNAPYSDKDVTAFKEANSKLKVLSITELRALGKENPTDPVPPQPTDLYCIMYTSGSTGPPKGVPISHECIVAGVSGLYSAVSESISHREAVLAYLPLAHIFELVLENVVLYIGGTLGYGSPRTLVDSSTRNCAGDLREFKPTVMVGVPQVWETVKKGVEGRVNSSGAVTKALFWGAFNLKSTLVAAGLPGATIFDKIVFGKVRQMTGNRLRFIFNGASGISKGTQTFLSMVVAPMISGYGLTETCANGALGNPLQFTTDAIGPVGASTEIKLVSIPELNYSVDSNPPQGEILLRGKAIFSEYYQNPEETEKAFAPGGWFKTGDIGEIDSNGHVKVIDRVKNLVKMQGGEYIALEKVEAVYRGSQYVQNLIVYGDSEHPRAIAIITPAEKNLTDLAKSLNVDEKEMHKNKEVRNTVLKDLQTAARNGRLDGLETITNVVIVDDEWTPDSGLVTATQKVNRRAIKEKYKKEIEAAFKGA